MRLRITKFLKGDIDGILLDHFHVGETYDVGTTLASYLLALGAAVPVIDEQPIHTIPTDLPRRSKAADGRSRKRKVIPKNR